MKRLILRSTIVNDDACDIAKINCLGKHDYLIWHYWNHNFRGYIRNSLYMEKNKISEESIMEALTK